MTPILAAALPAWKEVLRCPTFWALISGALGLWLLLPARFRLGRSLGGLLVAMAGGLFAYDLPRLGPWVDQGVFWLLAAVSGGGGVAMIASRSPVYSAIWFALSLLGTAGLFLFNGAEFLGVATIVVYAGAIVVTFLFVIMLAQPEGNASYDRVTWGGLPKILGVATAGLLIGVLTLFLSRLKDQGIQQPSAESISQAQTNLVDSHGILADKHVANLGRHLFSEHLISIELAGTLLFVALVGAIAIVMHGRPRLAERIEEALR